MVYDDEAEGSPMAANVFGPTSPSSRMRFGLQISSRVGTDWNTWADIVTSEIPSALPAGEETKSAYKNTYTYAHTYTPETRSVEAKTLTTAAVKSAEARATTITSAEARATTITSAEPRSTTITSAEPRSIEAKATAHDIEAPRRGTEVKTTARDFEVPRREPEAKSFARDIEVHRHGPEEQLMEDSRIHLCSSVVTSEVQCLKSELEILKRSLEEEMQARKTGDALNGEACMQLQAVLELEQQQRAQLATNVDEHVNGAISKLSGEISDQRLALESEVLVRLQGHEKLETHFQAGSADSFRALRNEVEQEIKQRTADFERLRNSLQVEVAMRESSAERWTEFATKIDNMAESIRAEKTERQIEERSLQQLITTLAEQTNLAIEEESTGLWDALHSHNHDVILENHGTHQLGSVQVQSMTQLSGLPQTTKSGRKIQLSQKTPPTHTSPSLTRNFTENSSMMQTAYHQEMMHSQNYANEFGQHSDIPKSSFPHKRITLPGLMSTNGRRDQ